MVKMVPVFLEGYASMAYHFEIEPKLSIWADVKQASVKLFAPLSGQLASFTSRRQSIGEPCLKYILAMQSLVALDDKAFTDHFVFAVIRDGLLPEVRRAIKLHKPTDLTSLKELCMAYDSSGQAVSKP